MALSYALWAVSHNFMLFVVARIIGGLSKGNVSLSTAIVTDVTTAEKRSKGMVSLVNVIILAYIGLYPSAMVHVHRKSILSTPPH